MANGKEENNALAVSSSLLIRARAYNKRQNLSTARVFIALAQPNFKHFLANLHRHLLKTNVTRDEE